MVSALSLSFFAFANTTVAHAEPPPIAAKGKLRIHLDTEFFSWTHSRPFYEPGAVKDPENPRDNSIGFGFGRPIYSEASDLGGVGTPSNTMIGLGAGYGIHRYLILGARLGFNLTRAGQRTDDPATAKDSNVVFVGGFMPYLEILPLPEGKGRFLPYVLVRTGFSGSTLTSKGDKDGEKYLSRISTIAPVLGIGGGAHAFLTQYFSIDFGLTFDYRWIHSRARGNFPGEPEIKSEWQRAGQGFTLALALGMSTWF